MRFSSAMLMMPHQQQLYLQSTTMSPAVTKLLGVLEDYRQQNFGQTLYSRYVKQMVSAMDANSDGKISQEELSTLLHNIGIMSSTTQQQGAAPQLTEEDLQAVVEELGEEEHANESNKQIHVDCVQELFLSVDQKR